MKLPKGAVVAVADGAKLSLFRNNGDEANPNLVSLTTPAVDVENMSSGVRHRSSAANPDDSTQNEDAFAAGTAGLLNAQVLAGKIDHLIVIAAPRTLGELRKHWHKELEAKLVGEIPKTLTGHSADQIAEAIAKA